jgi:putative tryptophan/tyrosine transport system substrate-binding protein
MRRRDFITLLGGAAAWPVAARAQQPVQRLRRIGVLCRFDGNNPLFRSYVAETLRALSQMGWESGRNVQVIERWPGADSEQTAIMAKELVALQPDVIFTQGGSSAIALQKETRAIPIVFLYGDPVRSGLVGSLARPSGNLTGISYSEETFTGKMLSLLKAAAPRITRAAIMFNPATEPPINGYRVDSFQTAAHSLAIEPMVAHVRSDEDVERTITMLGNAQGGLVAAPNTFNNIHRATVIASSLRHGVPVIFDGLEFAKQGGLLQYGPDFRVLQRRLAFYVDRILRGTEPSDLPVELPTKYIFIVNLKTAKAIGLEVSGDVISTADDVIE